MLNWKELSEKLDHALTLDAVSAAEFIRTMVPEGDAREAANRLLETLHPSAGFMSTRAGEEVVETASLDTGALLGPWRIEHLIGRGGMGEIYRASRADGLYEQTVALKLIQGISPERSLDFEDERRQLALMEHPGIARIVDGGTAPDGRPFMAMEFIDGVPVDQYCREQDLSRTHSMRLVAKICDAVSHAHARLILHRDIKPANVLVDAGGNPRLIDFGIAASLSQGALRGGPLTLYCAAPEQLTGGTLGVQTDVFALGVLLHELTLSKRPIRVEDGGMHIDDNVAPSKDLAAILNRALATDPTDRYASADALAQDIRACIEHRPVAARPATPWYRLSKLLRRAPIATTLAVSLVAALAGGLIISQQLTREAQQEADRANAALQKSEWQWSRTEANLAAQQAYSDILQRAFGGDGETDRLSSMLMERWQSAWADRENDPDTAAAISYAVGRNFYFRRDFKRALEVFDPWMTSGIGPKPLVENGEEVYALMLTDVGRTQEAEPRLRALVAQFETGFQESDADLFNYAMKLARITRDDTDLSLAETVILRLIPNDTEPFESLFHQNQLAVLRLMRNDREGALSAFVRALEIFDANPQLAIYGRDAVRYNVAAQELGYRRDLQRAGELADLILTEDVALRGESAQKALGLLIKALIADERDQIDEALRMHDDAAALFVRFTGATSPQYVATMASKTMVLARADRGAEARAILSDISALGEEDSVTPAPITLAELYLQAQMAAPGIKLDEEFEAADIASQIRGNAISMYWFQRFVEQDRLSAELIDPG